jgi:plasmid stability protein
MKQITVNLPEEQIAALKARAAETGVLVSEQIRRAIDFRLRFEKPHYNEAERAYEFPHPGVRQPVLFTPKASE